MVTSALTGFLISIIAFTVLLVMVSKERRRGRRFFAGRLRGWFDGVFEKIGKTLVKSWEHFSKYIVQLNWYYSIHSVLKSILKLIVAVYTYFENIFEDNRTRTKELRAEKRQLSELNHLQQMSAHRQETELTPAQKRKLKQKNLEGKY